MEHQYHDGGRSNAGYKGATGDCAVRSVAIATGRSYQEVYDGINQIAKVEKHHKKRLRSSSRNGVFRETLNKYLESVGWEWIPTMKIGSGCQVHLRSDELPKESIVVRLSGHFAAVVDGVLFDTYDCSRNGTRCVYGYWREKV
jgi:hypothetical protein